MKKVLVIGGSGFLGSRIVKYLTETGYYKVQAPTHRELDVTQEEAVRKAVKTFSPDYVIHCAAISDVGKCEENPVLSHKMNVESPALFAKACEEIGGKLIFCSSDQIYFGSKGMEPHREAERVTPANTYGKQKLQAEKQCQSLHPATVSLRLSWLYDNETLLPNEHGHFIRNIREALEREEALCFPVHDYRGITYVGDVLKNLPKVLKLPGGIYNYGAENTMSTYELSKELFREKNIPERFLKKNTEAFSQQPRNLCMNMEKGNSHGIQFPSTLTGLFVNYM